MSVKRRDNKKRILRNGEYQRKDGRYMFTYVDLDGKPKNVYSWKLEPTDVLPKGKRKCISLREQEKEIQKALLNNEKPQTSKLTVAELAEKYLTQRTILAYNTKLLYINMMKIIEKESFGHVKIDKVKLSDAKEWVIKLQSDGRSFAVIKTLVKILKPAFQMAIDDELLNKNPFNFSLSKIVTNDSGKREALTYEQVQLFLNFIKNSKVYCRYYPAIYILFNTGLRISELSGLTLSDIDLENKIINVDHQLLKFGNGSFSIEKTKTKSGTRTIPITDEVCNCLKEVIKNRSKPKHEFTVDGKSGFLFLNKNDKPVIAARWLQVFNGICVAYNKKNEIKLPKITPHVCRHTYCTIMANNGMNPKVLQYLMGHSDINITLNLYAHVDFENVAKNVNHINTGIVF